MTDPCFESCSNLTILFNFSCDIKIGSFVDVEKEKVDLFSSEDSAELTGLDETEKDK